MKKYVQALLGLSLSMLIVSCGMMSTDNNKKNPEKAPTLADLQPAVMPDPNTTLPEVKLESLIDVYKDVLSVTEEPELQVQVLQRLAGLEMKRSENQLLEEQADGQFDMAIGAYKRLIEKSPGGEKSDRLMYQLSKAYDLSGNLEESMKVLDEQVAKYPDSIHYAEAQFRRAEIFFSRPDYRNAELAYAEVIKKGEKSSFYKNALYMNGWSLFKQERYRASLRSFIKVLDLNVPKDNNLEKLKRGDRELTLDVLRVTSVVFSYLDGAKTVQEVYGKLGERHYMPLVYDELGKLYLKNERYADSAQTYRAFVDKYPSSDQSPVFYASLIDAYLAGAFADDVLREKENYIKYYGFYSEFWKQKTAKSRDYIRPYLKQYLPELARHYHSRGQSAQKATAAGRKGASLKQARERFVKAANYYQEFIDTFPVDEQVPEIQFLMAESLFESGNYAKAIKAYEVVAYQYPDSKRGKEAGYSAIVSHTKLLDVLGSEQPKDVDKIEAWLRLKINSQLRFANSYQTDKRAPAVLVKSSEELLQLAEYTQAREAAELLILMQPPAEKSLRKTAWLVIGNSQFELNLYEESEQAYKEALALIPRKDKSRPKIVERLAASIYKQGEAALNFGDGMYAANQFLRVTKIAPGSAIAVTAQYDAANAYIAASAWNEAIKVLTQFRSKYPNNKLSADIPAKLVVAYQNSGQTNKAAGELSAIYNSSDDEAVKRESLYTAAELYEKSGDVNKAIDRYKSYVYAFPAPFDTAMEVRFKLSELYLLRKDGSKRRFWLKKMITADAKAGSQRTDRSRYLAAMSSSVFANDSYQSFKAIPLKLPLKKSLKKKKKALNKALASYKSLADYGVQEFATLATFRVAAIYQMLSADLMNSERPKGLDELALEEYGILLEEQAFPFEEKSITIHETNTQRSWQGTYDEWIRESFSSLKLLLPARYGKDERGITFENEIY